MDRWTRLALHRHTLHRSRSISDARPVDRAWVDVAGQQMHVRHCGDPLNPPVVLVHGLAVSSLYMVPLASELGGQYRVLAPDLPGFGYTDGPWRGMGIEELADSLAAFLQEMRLGAPVLVGNSMGCQIVADLAVRHPKLTRAVVLQGPTIDPYGRSTPQQLLRWLITSTIEPTSMGLVLAHDYALCGMRRLLGTFRQAMADRIEDKLPRIEVPAMVVRGSSDRVISERWAREAAELLPRGVLREIPGAAHTINFEAPLELARVVRPFIDREFAGARYRNRRQ